MKSVLLAALATVALAGPASAQYYERYYGEPAPPSQGDARAERMQRMPRYDYYEERSDYGYGPRRGREWREDRYYAQPRRDRYRQAERFGSLCVTSRGSCGYPQSLRSGARCSCDIPGFGLKRGNIQR
ncbi:hypothetical protein MHY87_04550 [Microvirga sp. ACRRW]|uniref:hypothetical protein n=1 Tax=Microvirga sp. ACRRW TaxID=2918205 RepID=UPI001EF58B81|nr:hypothetical protein [Microvirga sp. ACRRW]MCG7392171.1 hypothetical protein [Microvirga sp. ACRRW]